MNTSPASSVRDTRLAGRDIGLVGLGVMGRNLALNIDRRGFSVSVHDQSRDAITRCVAALPSDAPRGFAGFEAIDAFVASLAKPRRILVMVNAGAPVDDVLDRLLAHLEPGDIVIDGGNSHFRDTQRRSKALEARGLHFVGAGVSGGEKGALEGPALMPGGSNHAWQAMRPIYEAIAAKVDGDPCVTHVGPDGAGHFVKMVHNGIEYADMQLIGETYALMTAAGLSSDTMADVFARWNGGPLQSYLIAITSHILRERDARSGGALVDVILDQAEQKGTGQWAVVEAAEAGVVAGAFAAAVEARVLSSQKAARVAASKVLAGPPPCSLSLAAPGGGASAASARPGAAGGPPRRIEVDDVDAWVAMLHDALLAGKIVAYAQGLDLMRTAGARHGWNLPLGAIARIWRGGCIIRARFLGRIAQACEADASPRNLMTVPVFAQELERAQPSWRRVVATAVASGVPLPAMSAALAYFDGYRSERLPANLLQAQRDFFGAHTYRRIDSPESERFHTPWPDVEG